MVKGIVYWTDIQVPETFWLVNQEATLDFAAPTGLEPVTLKLTASCSAELS